MPRLERRGVSAPRVSASIPSEVSAAKRASLINEALSRRLFPDGEGLALGGGGVGLGLLFGVGVGRLMDSIFVDVSAFDATTFVVAPLLLLGASVCAAWLPARRATIVNPVVGLRAD